MLTLSRNLAVLIGVIAPLLETYRRWSTWQNDPSSFFDDYIICGLLLFGAWQVSKNARAGQKYLAAGWGFTLGMMYASFFFQLQQMKTGAPDPSAFSNQTVVAIKGLGFLLVTIGFITSLVKVREEN